MLNNELVKNLMTKTNRQMLRKGPYDTSSCNENFHRPVIHSSDVTLAIDSVDLVLDLEIFRPKSTSSDRVIFSTKSSL